MKSENTADKDFIYDQEKHEAHMTVDGYSVTLTFKGEHPENCIWHYIFTAVARKADEDAHPSNC